MMEFIQQQLENEFLSGGAVLMILGAFMAAMRNVPGRVSAFLHRKVITTVDINDQDEAFYWVQQWLSHHPYSGKSRLLSVATENSSYAPDDAKQPISKNLSILKDTSMAPDKHGRQPKIYFTPAPGIHIMKFEGHWIYLNRIREKQEGSSGSRFWREQFILKTLVKDRQYLRRLLMQARDIASPPDEGRINVFTNNSYAGWNLSGTRLPRGFDSVILDDGVMSTVVHRVKEFYSSAEWYQERGIPYQMGFMFYGQPGNGKTSTAIAIATRFQRDIHVVKVDTMTSQDFRQLMSNLPEHSVLLIEDIDCFFQDRAHEKEKIPISESFLSFSGFLNTLDGVMGTEGRILILTTNHPERLDQALLRPGRVDHKIEFTNASRNQAGRLFLRFFPEEEERAADFADGVGDDRYYSMADLQKILLDNRNNPEGAIEYVRRGVIRSALVGVHR